MKFSFDEFITGSFDYDALAGAHTSLHLRPEGGELAKEKISIKDIDRLKEYPGEDIVTISGLTQKTFEYFIKTYGKSLRAIRFFKNKLVEDWSLLSTLENIEYIDWFQNHRITELWDMSKNKALTGLRIFDFTRLDHIDGIEAAPSLKTFLIGNAGRKKMILQSLSPLGRSTVEVFGFTGKDILDKDLSFLDEAQHLRTFDFPGKLYKAEQVAWIAANYPQLSGRSILPYVSFVEENLLPKSENTVSHTTIDKRLPVLRLPGQEKRLRSYAEAFEMQKERLKGVSYTDEFSDDQRRKRISKGQKNRLDRQRKVTLKLRNSSKDRKTPKKK